jgi:hypothetical protein
MVRMVRYMWILSLYVAINRLSCSRPGGLPICESPVPLRLGTGSLSAVGTDISIGLLHDGTIGLRG